MGEQEPEADPGRLVAEALRKSALLWLVPPGAGRHSAYWHAEVNGTAYLLSGPGEQPDAEVADGDTVRVLVRSKDNGHRLVTFDATVRRLRPDDDDWPAATSALASNRLNLRSAPTAPARWRDPAFRLYRLIPTGTVHEQPGEYTDASHTAAPVPTPATTAQPRPFVLHRRHTRRPPLS